MERKIAINKKFKRFIYFLILKIFYLIYNYCFSAYTNVFADILKVGQPCFFLEQLCPNIDIQAKNGEGMAAYFKNFQFRLF